MMLRRVKCVAEQVTGSLAQLLRLRCEALKTLVRYCLKLIYKCPDAGVYVLIKRRGFDDSGQVFRF
jgi:hypothetical protein